MTIRTVVQNSFSGGQVDASVAGRSDLDGYKTSALKMQNFMPTKTGSMRRRPNTIFCCNPFDQYVPGSEDTADGLSFRNSSSSGSGTLFSFDDATDRQTLLSVSPSMVNLIEFGRPRTFDVGSFAFCPRIKNATAISPNATVDWAEVGCVPGQTIGQQDYETRSPENLEDRYERPSTALMRRLQIEDIMYLAPGGRTPMHACYRASLIGGQTYRPTSSLQDPTVGNNNQSIVNMPVGYLDGPYTERHDLGGDSPGVVFAGSWPQFVQDAIDEKARLMPCADYNGNVPRGLQQVGVRSLELRLGDIVLHVLTKTEANVFRTKFGRKPIDVNDTIRNHGIDQLEGEAAGLADVLNQKLPLETPYALEIPNPSEFNSKTCRFAFSFLGAFSCALKNTKQGSVDFDNFYPGANDTTEVFSDAETPSTFDTIGGEERELTILALRVNQTKKQDPFGAGSYDIKFGASGEVSNQQDPDPTAFEFYPYRDPSLRFEVNGPSGSLARCQEAYQKAARGLTGAVLRLGPDTISGVAAMAQSQGRMQLAFKSLPGRVFSTAVNGFSILVGKAGIDADLINGYVNSALNDRVYLDFRDSDVTDISSVTDSDAVAFLTVGDSGAKIRHITSFKSQVLVSTASALLAISPARGEVLTPTNAKIIKLLSTGCSRTTPPVVVDDKLYFIDATDSRLTEVKLSNEAGTDAETREVSVASSSVITGPIVVQGGGPGIETQKRVRSMTLHQYPVQHLRIVRTDGVAGIFVCESEPNIKAFSTYSLDTGNIETFCFANDKNGTATFGIANLQTSVSGDQTVRQVLFREARELSDGYEEGRKKLDLSVYLTTEDSFTRPADGTIFTEDGEVEDVPYVPPPPQLYFESVNVFCYKFMPFALFDEDNEKDGYSYIRFDTYGDNPGAKPPYVSTDDKGEILIAGQDEGQAGYPIPVNSVPVGRKLKLKKTANTRFDNISPDVDHSPSIQEVFPIQLTDIEMTVENPSYMTYKSSFYRSAPPFSHTRAALGEEFANNHTGDNARCVLINKEALGSPTFGCISGDETSGFNFDGRMILGLEMFIITDDVPLTNMTTKQTENAKVPHLAGQVCTLCYQGREYIVTVSDDGTINFSRTGLTNFPEGGIIGVKYTSEFESMPVQTIAGNKGQGNDPRSDKKRVYSVGLHLNRSAGGLCGVSELDPILYKVGKAVSFPVQLRTGVIDHSVQDDGGNKLRTVKIRTNDVHQFELQAMHVELDKGGY